VREDFADYFGEIQAFDAGLGVLLTRLEEIGELENTLLVVSGDHGPPGFPRGKCDLYDFGTGVPLAIRWGAAQGGRIVDDFVNLMDLAPTFLEAAGLNPPEVMNGRSLLNVLKSRQSGLVDPERTFVVTGRERHVARARDGSLPYPMRGIRTRDFLYIINFKPDRWPMGNPHNIDGEKIPSPEALTENTFVTYMDMDAGPTKAWLVSHRNDPAWKWHYDLAFAKRPREELYDLRNDPDQVRNVAGDPAFSEPKRKLEQRLMSLLRETNDPRLNDVFDHPPFVD
jgi:N-sulfoglucosamine sulfohydrolase